jgi:hypothetical protein
MVIPEANVHFYRDAIQAPYPVEWRVAGGPLRASSMKAGEIGIVAKRLLSCTKLGITEIGGQLGFSDQSHFTLTFRKFVGTTPARWRACS